MKVKVKVFENEMERLSKEFEEGTYLIGRGDTCDIVLESQSISRQHAELRVTDSAVYLTNQSSSGKIFVNGSSIETVELTSGDQFDIGGYRIMVLMGTMARTQHSKVEPVLSEEPIMSPAMDNPEELGNAPVLEMENPDGGFAPLEDPFADQPVPQSEGSAALAIQDPMESPEEAPLSQPELVPDSMESGTSIGMGETQVQAKPLVAKLKFEDGPRDGEELLLETYEVTFGRSKKADVFIDDDKLSRIHAKISRVGMGYRLVDMGSRNGTYVNGMRVLEHPLNSYDVISIGRSKINFLIHEIIAEDPLEASHVAALTGSGVEQTRSVQLTPSRQAQIIELQQQQAQQPAMGMQPPTAPPGSLLSRFPNFGRDKKSTPLTKMLLAALIALAVVLVISPDEKPKPKAETAATTPGQVPGATTPKADAGTPTTLPPSMPQEYFELSPENQRALEGHYRSAIRAAETEKYDEAVFHLSKVHDLVPYYKQSRDMLEMYERKVKEKEIAEAEVKAKRDDKQDLAIYLEEGIEYLRLGDFDRAAESFNSAIVVDPNNETARKGLRAADLKIRDLQQVPPEQDPEMDKRKQVIELFQKAVAAFANKSYSEAINTAEEIRKIQLQGDTQYLNEAKQIIDRARMLQKEEFEPFLIQAKEKYAEADYNASRDLCEEMVKRDPNYGDAQECLLKAKRQLNRLAKEAYVHGYILESMNKIDDAKQYWMRAKNYVRKGDEYYDKVIKKLEYYE
ncbi:MAG: FHA domain-containing protein [Bdellovibrionaceae bacterium]|nr:FHA domain-containing protein [Bdellovibrionales bacterium]MCB9255459.1 FHA domain-containing protein [Pseudobdellovibrionaceae bacterium]